MLELGIDEITLVLQLSSVKKKFLETTEWQEMAEAIINGFEKKSDFVNVFGKRDVQKHLPQGYTHGISYGENEHSFYTATIGYHHFYAKMGVIVKFSAQALDYYCEKTGLQVYEFLQKVEYDSLYTMRLSRVDCVCDYIDENINVTEIYQDLINNRVGVFYEYINKKSGKPDYRRNRVDINGIARGQDIATVYLGSVKSNSRMRIYDKRFEQIERKGNKLEKARNCHDWVRFELVLRHEYSHQIGEKLFTIQNDEEFADLIANSIAQKFQFFYIEDGVIDCETLYTQLLLDTMKNKNLILKAPSSKNFDLIKSIKYLYFGSGIVSTLYKIKEIFGENALSTFINTLQDYVSEWEPNDDCRYWLYRNKEDYNTNFPDFDLFLRENLLLHL